MCYHVNVSSCNTNITTEELWWSVRRRDFGRPVRFFLWMMLHDGYMVGRHWKHINGCEDRVLSKCKECNTEESMEHILTMCDAPGQELVWNLARNIWRKKTNSELVITKGTIMSCGVQPPTAYRSAAKRDMERFRQILVSESAHSEREIEQRWLSALNRRLRTDCLL